MKIKFDWEYNQINKPPRYELKITLDSVNGTKYVCEYVSKTEDQTIESILLGFQRIFETLNEEIENVAKNRR